MQSKCTDECKKPTPFQAHCGSVGCHRTFGGIGGFDQHRIGDVDKRICRDPTTFGYVLRDGVWREPMDHDKVAQFRERVRKDKEKR